MARDGGVTLVELAIVIAVLAVTVTVAVPGFGRMVSENRVIAQSNKFLSTLHLARSEAIRRGQRVTVCPSTDGQSCSEDSPYNAGWILFAGPAVDEDLADAGPVLHGFPASREGISISGNGSMARYISYVPSGRTAQLSGAFQAGTVSVCSDDGINRRIVISRTGRARVVHDDC